MDGDSQTNAAWAGVYRAFDILSPWSVGRYSTLSGADDFKNNYIVPDRVECAVRRIDYMPVVFTGFSWKNQKSTTTNLPALNHPPATAARSIGGRFTTPSRPIAR